MTDLPTRVRAIVCTSVLRHLGAAHAVDVVTYKGSASADRNLDANVSVKGLKNRPV